MNTLSDIQKNLDKLILYKCDVKSHHWVHITHINNPLSFYVRATICSDFVNALGSVEPPVKLDTVQLHDVVIMKLENHSPKYVRGKILKVENSECGIKCDAFVLDIGSFVKSVPIQDIYQCDQDLFNLPSLVTYCRLGYCVPVGDDWTQKAIDAFKIYAGSEQARMIILDKGTNQLVVELHNSCPDDIATLLALIGYSDMGYVPQNKLN